MPSEIHASTLRCALSQAPSGSLIAPNPPLPPVQCRPLSSCSLSSEHGRQSSWTHTPPQHAFGGQFLEQTWAQRQNFSWTKLLLLQGSQRQASEARNFTWRLHLRGAPAGWGCTKEGCSIEISLLLGWEWGGAGGEVLSTQDQEMAKGL